MQKVTINDIARTAGVSVGTVSKVLNGDTSVKQKNRDAVQQAVLLLGYNVNKVARSLAHKPIKIGIMLPSAFETYFDSMRRGIEQVIHSLADYKVEAVYRNYAKFDDDQKVIECLDAFISQNVNGILLGPLHRMGGYESILSVLQACKIPVVLIVSEFSCANRLACVSIDAALSGKTAAELAALAVPVDFDVAVFVGNKDVEEHRIKAESFCQRITQLQRNAIGIFETQDEPELAFLLAMNIIKQSPRLRLIYVATGNSVAVCKAICSCGKQEEIRVIATDLLNGLQPYIEQGIVIGTLDQHFEEQGAVAVTTLYQYLAEGVLPQAEIKIAPSVLLQSGMLEKMSIEMK